MRRVAVVGIALLILACASVAFAQAPAPLAMNNRTVGGGAVNQYTPGVEGGTGLNNIGLLIRTWGKVTFVDTTNKFFYIDDGTAREDGSGNPGIRVSYDNLASGNVIDPPKQGTYAMVTCISSTIMIDGKIQSNLRPRGQSDIQWIQL